MSTAEAAPSVLRAWWALVCFSFGRQARARQMVGVALGLLVLTCLVVAIFTLGGRWGMDHLREPRGSGAHYSRWFAVATAAAKLSSGGLTDGVTGAMQTVLDHSGFLLFSRHVVFGVFLNFLLPLWTLSFATEALGSERESRTLIWLLTRPLPRWSVYLAKFVALLPWSLGLGVGGFALICLLAGPPGRLALSLDWPAVAAATLAFSALFHLLSACFRRPAVVAIAYAFFLELVFGNLPGTLKRVSIGFYARCIMFDAAERLGVSPPDRPEVYLPVDATTAWVVLLGATVLCLLAGTVVFARSENVESV